MNRKIRILIIDVDGTMTDSGIYYDENGNELKKFSTRDAAGFFAAHELGIKTMILTGRECEATVRRMKELKVNYLCQNIKDKVEYIYEFMKKNHYQKNEIGYIGDDLNDLSAMRLVGFVACPADSCQEVIEIADYISNFNGGCGVVRDVIEHILRESGEWSAVVDRIYGCGI